ncbi:hypothetical protein PG994_003449 [Apiospora phragmitis]|uniref:Uncharacterized protein n=1 Tax=Apiospora phragmitis TaxID=2905665 RepID=A0ABR1VZE8_9PEZI
MIHFGQLVVSALLCAGYASATLLVDYNAARGDEVSKIGLVNLEAARGDKQHGNTADLYIKNDKDWKGGKSAHFHRKKGDIRAEYHALNGKTQEGKTYFIGYQFALGATPDGMIVMQWKEYVANTAGHDAANIPLSLEVREGQLQLQYHAQQSGHRQPSWSAAIQPKTVYTVGLEILAKDAGQGHVRMWWAGKPVTFAATGSTTLPGNLFPGRSDPKFGIYGGQEVVTDSWVYQVQISESKGDLDPKFMS